MPVKHRKHSTAPDVGGPQSILISDWNENAVGTGGADGLPLLRKTAHADGMDFAATAAEARTGLDVYSQDEVDALIAANPGPPGPAGPAGPAGADGADGADGATGPAGPGVAVGGMAGQVLTKNSATNYDTVWAAPTGGGTGGSGLSLAYNWSTTTTPPPSSNQVRVNAASPYTAVTMLYVSTDTTDGIDAKNILMLAKVGQRLYVQDKNDAGAYVAVTLTVAPVDQTSYVEFACAFFASAGTLPNNQACILILGPVPSADLSNPVLIGQGGTGATTAAGARTNLDVFSKSEIQGGVALDGAGDLALLLANNNFVKGNETGGTARALIGVNGSNWCIVGDPATPTVYVSTTLTLPNATLLAARNAANSANQALIGLDASDQVIVSDGTHVVIVAGPLAVTGAITLTMLPNKGDLMVGDGSNTTTKVAVGTNGQVLTADSTVTGGVKWAAVGNLPPTWGQFS